MGRMRHVCWVFCKHLYTLGILLASDPFDIADRWFRVNYSPPGWLFWLLLAIATCGATVLTFRELRAEARKYSLTRLPSLVDQTIEHLESKTKKTLEEAKKLGTVLGVLKLNRMLLKCTTVFGLTETLPKPTSLPVTKRYRKSIERRVPTDVRRKLQSRDEGLEYETRIGGILDKEGYGLQPDQDRRYLRLRRTIDGITRHYVGPYSAELTESTNNLFIRIYASYSFALFSGYWEILLDFAKSHGQDNLVSPEAEGIASLKYAAIDRYLNEELEKVKTYLGLALQASEHMLGTAEKTQS